MIYDYLDSFLIDSLASEEVEKYEAQAIEEVEKLGIEDEHYKKRLIINRVYMHCSKAQLEAEGMSEKYKIYEKEFDRALKEAMIYKNSSEGIHSDETVWNIKIVRS